jgi:GAF domain-containing protein
VAQEKAAEAQMREQKRALEVLNRVASIIAGELKTESVVQAITDAGVELTGAQSGAFFYKDSRAATLACGRGAQIASGYSRNAIVHHGRLDSGVQLISKPFTFEQLGQRIRDLLDRP